MTQLHVGAVLDRLPSLRYGERLAFCEYAPRAPLPRVPTIRRWFYRRPFDTQVGLVAPRSVLVDRDVPLPLSEGARAGFDWLASTAAALEAAYVVLPTGRELTPGARDRQRLEAFCQALQSESGRPVVWAPGGMWEPDAAAQQARHIGVGLALDVLEHPVAAMDTVHARISAVGSRARLGRGHLEQALEKILAAAPDHAYLAVDAEPPTKHALRAQEIALALAEDEDSVRVATPTRRVQD